MIEIFTFLAAGEIERWCISKPLGRYFRRKEIQATLMRWDHRKAIPVLDELAGLGVRKLRQPGQVMTWKHRAARKFGLQAIRALAASSTMEKIIDLVYLYKAKVERDLRYYVPKFRMPYAPDESILRQKRPDRKTILIKLLFGGLIQRAYHTYGQ